MCPGEQGAASVEPHTERHPFRFDLRALLSRFRSLPVDVEATLEIGLPGFRLRVKRDDVERRVASELVIRLADRRVLNATECCDTCIDQALDSIQEIRGLLVDKQVELARKPDSALSLLIEMMLEAIRQFLTFEQRLSHVPRSEDDLPGRERPWLRDPEARSVYFAIFERLRGHLNRTMLQIAAIGDTSPPKTSIASHYGSTWDLDAYVEPAALPRPDDAGAC